MTPPTHPRAEPLDPDIRNRLRGVLARLREIRATETLALNTARSSAPLAAIPIGAPFRAVIASVRRDLETMGVVELNLGEALLDGDMLMAGTAGSVVSVLDERIDRGLTLMDGYLNCVSEKE